MEKEAILRIIILSWEFPPRIIGDIAHFVEGLSVELVKNNVDVHIITYNDALTGYEKRSDGVKIHREIEI